MAPASYTVLIVDDSAEDRHTWQRYLQRAGDAAFCCREADTVAAGLALCRQQLPDAIVLDYCLPDADGLAFLAALSDQYGANATAVVVLTGMGDEAVAVQAMKQGAQDYLVKNGRLEHRLPVAICSAVEKVRLYQEVERQRHDLERSNRELQRALNAARASDAQLRMALQVASMQAWEWDLAAGTVLVSAGIDAAGVSVSAAADFWAAVCPDDSDAVEQYLAALLSGGATTELEFRMCRPGGHVRWFANRASVVRDADGRPLRVIGLLLDITERKVAQLALSEERALLAQRVAERTAELRAANLELARAAQLKDEFLASMSHELRTPLNAVLGFAASLADGVYGPVTARQQRAVEQIDASGRHLLALIGDILDLAKIGAGTVVLQRETASVWALCQASLEMISVAADAKSIAVQLAFDPAVTVLDVDARRFKQMLVNLLSNAVKFTPAGGTIGLDVVGDPERQAVDLTVWDTGIGIDAAQQERLFQPFVQLDSGLARQYEGAGLGLALVAAMARLHQGTVQVASEPGQGSRFTLTLPWRAAEACRHVPDPVLRA